MKTRSTSSILTKVIRPIGKSLNRSSWRRGLFLIPVVVVVATYLAISPSVWAECRQGCDNVLAGTFLGEDALVSLTTGALNTAVGNNALSATTDGIQNTAVGASALKENTSGGQNAAFGVSALAFCTTGAANTAIGNFALLDNYTGDDNTAVGFAALQSVNAESNTAVGFGAMYGSGDGPNSGSFNTAVGVDALTGNSTGSNNVANGFETLFNNSTGSSNVANGAQALYSNTIGLQNTASGYETLYSNISGINNTAVGHRAMFLNTTASYNTAAGDSALYSNTTGAYNIASGASALLYNTSGGSNTALGASALLNNTTGSNNIGLGGGAGQNLTTGNDNIDIGNTGFAGESAKIRIGTKGTHKNVYVAGISGVTVGRGVGVIVDINGHLGTVSSSARFKDEIKPMDKASEAILALEPVTFRYKHELDPDQIPQFGLVAEQVAKVNPDLVARDEEGRPYTVRYEAVNAMLLNEFLKEHRKVEEQTEINQRQEAIIGQLEAALKEQAVQIERLSARMVARQSAPQVADNDQSKTNR